MTTDTDHDGTLEESGYGFVCWVTCSCGWRSKGYPNSASAWTAYNTHRMLRGVDD